jgi:hypothetical protein
MVTTMVAMVVAAMVAAMVVAVSGYKATGMRALALPPKAMALTVLVPELGSELELALAVWA